MSLFNKKTEKVKKYYIKIIFPTDNYGDNEIEKNFNNENDMKIELEKIKEQIKNGKLLVRKYNDETREILNMSMVNKIYYGEE